jgi:hypothetical protein
MRVVNLALLSLLALAACENRAGERETGRAGEGADTMVTSEQTLDTTIVTEDTAMDVDVDTVQKEGDETVRDTVQR